ncbi:hypothetical protein [Dactylosporangium sp. CA-233914]|uniref:hypothetical protein n=1 Tax=Dactylosporangium sp. CA-233914 TaxID=3239934 RepID=UPI003D8C6D5C
MADPFDVADVFVVRPTNVLMALLPGREQTDRVLTALLGAGDRFAGVKVMHGDRGLRILDWHGEHHGFLAGLKRRFQKMTYDDAILGLYSGGLKAGEFLLYVPAAPQDRSFLSEILRREQAHGVYYFGYSTAEELSAP